MTSDQAGMDSTAADPLDVAVVGAGVSGLYVAWRLITADLARSDELRRLAAGREQGQLKVQVFEQSNRIGGRLWSVVMPGMPRDLPAEVGGMRFVDQQTYVAGLIKHLKLDYVEFPFGDPNDYQYLRRRQFRLSDYVGRPWLVPYALSPKELGMQPTDLLTWAIEQIVPGINTNMTPAEWEQFKRITMVRGKHLWEWGFWNLLADVLSIEAYNYIADAGGYYSLISNWNAAEAMQEVLGDFPGVPKYLKLKYGYQQLPLTVADLFRQEQGAIALNTTVGGLTRHREGDQDLIAFTASGLPGADAQMRYARHVVLAMPRRSLELISAGSPLLQESGQLHDDLRTVTAEAACKMFLTYDSPWWRLPPSSISIGGRSDTDLPLRQCYYWGAEHAADSGANPSLLMASYSDDRAVSFWDGYLDESARTTYLGLRLNQLHAQLDPELTAPATMVQEIQRQLREMHEPLQIPECKDAIFHDWRQDPYGGGWHFWNPHVQSWEVMPRIQHPIADASLYICGEAYSTDQGWVEGALATADQVLQQQFKLPPPSWVSTS